MQRRLPASQPCLQAFPPIITSSQVVARCGRIADQWGEPVPEWIDAAEAVLHAGLAQVRPPCLLLLRSGCWCEAHSCQAG